ncbi:MAG: hypothetical protein PHU53_01840 [Thermoplasmata archaeon]|nr:hypothetical protein [Thermoplasmata archaeon]
MKSKNNQNVRSMLFAALIAAVMLGTAPSIVLADTYYNDSWDEAEYTYDGAYVSGTLDEYSDYQDFYYIYLYYGETVNIDMTGYGDDFDLKLYTLDYDTYYYEYYLTQEASSTSYSSSESISFYVYSSETYYIEVYAPSGSGSYYLEVDVTQGAVGGDYYVGGTSYASGEPLATLPTLEVGDSAYFGGVTDIGEEYADQIDEMLTDPEYAAYLEDLDISYDISGGVGAYMGWEVASDDEDINGDTCYDIALFGAIGIDMGLEGSVDGSISESGYSASIDASASGSVQFEANLDGHLYLTVDEMAISKLTLTLTAEGEAQGELDAQMSYEGLSYNVQGDLTASMEGVKIVFELEFDPPLDVFQFGTGSGSTEGIYEGKQWYVPGEDTDVSGSISAEGTLSYDIHAEMAGEEPVNEADTMDLADEIGDESFSDTIPGGEPDYYDYYDYGGGTLFECTYASGDIFIIETEMDSMFGDIYGTRQLDAVTGMMPAAGMQYDGEAGMITGMTMDGEPMTEPCEEADVTAFTEAPLETVTDETGGASGGSNLMLILVIVIVIVVVILVVVMVVVRKKKAQPPQQIPPQGQYQQPPPPPQYPVQDQYGQYPPQDPYGQQQYQQPPPPPPQY